MRRKVYLSGPIERADDPESWRSNVEKSFGNIEFINPVKMNFDPWEDRHEMVWEQLKTIRSCDFLLVNYIPEVETYGTPMEMMWAFIQGVPVMTWSDVDPCNMPTYAVMFSDYISSSVDECMMKGWEYDAH